VKASYLQHLNVVVGSLPTALEIMAKSHFQSKRELFLKEVTRCGRRHSAKPSSLVRWPPSWAQSNPSFILRARIDRQLGPQTDVSPIEMLHHPRMAALTGRTAALCQRFNGRSGPFMLMRRAEYPRCMPRRERMPNFAMKSALRDTETHNFE
jgi:hypothetical protein